MYRALGALVAIGALGCGPAASPPVHAEGEPPAADICRAPDPVAPPSLSLPTVEPPWGSRIARVEIDGLAHIPSDVALERVRLRKGSILDSDAVASDVRALLGLEAVDTARADVERTSGDEVVLRYVLRERRVVGQVHYRGPSPPGAWVPLAQGELFDPARVLRTRIDLERALIGDGHLRAKVEAHHKITSAERVDVCFAVDPGPRFVIDRITFVGNARVPEGELTPLIRTHEDRANKRDKPFRRDLLDQDLSYIQAHYYERGYLDVKVGPPQTTMVARDGAHGQVSVTIPIHEGTIYRIRALRFSGIEPTIAKDEEQRLEIKSGDVFNRTKLVAGFEKIREYHRARGETIELSPNLKPDAARSEVELVIDASIARSTKSAK